MYLVQKSSGNTGVKQIAKSNFLSGKTQEDSAMLKDWQSFCQVFWREKKKVIEKSIYILYFIQSTSIKSLFFESGKD